MKQYNRGLEFKGILGDLDKINLDQIEQIEKFKEITGKSRSSFFRYKKVLRGQKQINSKDYKKHRLNQLMKESYNIVMFACKHWMKETGKSRSSFFRLKREVKQDEDKITYSFQGGEGILKTVEEELRLKEGQ